MGRRSNNKDNNKKRSKSMSTAAFTFAPPPPAPVNLGKITPVKIIKMHEETPAIKFYLCYLKTKAGRYGWTKGVYWVHFSCFSPEYSDADLIKAELISETDTSSNLYLKVSGFKTIMPKGVDETLRNLNFKVVQLGIADQSAKSLHFDSKELDHISKLSKGSDEEDDGEFSQGQQKEKSTGHTDPQNQFDGEYPDNLSAEINYSSKAFKQELFQSAQMLEELPQDQVFIGKRAAPKSDRPLEHVNMPSSVALPQKPRRTATTASTNPGMLQEEVPSAPHSQHQTVSHTSKLKFESLHGELNALFPRTLAEMKEFEVLGVTGVSHYNLEKYYSVVLKHKKDAQFRVMRILTGPELAMVLRTC